MRHILGLILTFILLLGAPAFAQTSRTNSDLSLEARAKEIGHSLRCVVCQNQSIGESDAPLAQDMRKLVRKRLEAGDSNEDVIEFMRDTYGDYVLLKPPVQTNTYALWALPFLLMAGGLLWFFLSDNKTPVSRAREIKLAKDKDAPAS